jgi:hypothetical protein
VGKTVLYRAKSHPNYSAAKLRCVSQAEVAAFIDKGYAIQIRGFNTARRGVEPNRTVTWCHHDFMTIVPFDTTLSIWASCSAAIFHFMHACWIIAFFLGLGGGESKKVMDI